MQDIPKLYTALAEWLACVIFMSQLKRRWNRGVTAGILAVYLVLLGILQIQIGRVSGYLWVLGMAVAVATMYGILLLCCRISASDTGFYWALAFMFAEFVASLEWQFFSFFEQRLGYFPWMEALFLAGFYGAGFAVLYRLESGMLKKMPDLRVTSREACSAAIVAIGAFAISNISYISSNTPLSGRMSEEIFYIRTLVDLAGVILLFTLQGRWQEMIMQRELDAIQMLLERQYEQYRLSRENMDTVNRKYHDLKNQIAVIRMESNGTQREEYLNQLESGLRSLGTVYHTGNDILDTILSEKQQVCDRNRITMTVMADGAKLAFMETMDLCSIVGNALDNAIESVEKLPDPGQRLIRVSVRGKNHLVLFRVENYCPDAPQPEEGVYRTTKKDRENHGYGIKSMRYIAEKYGGNLSISTADGWFYLKILLPVQPGAEEGRHDSRGSGTAR